MVRFGLIGKPLSHSFSHDFFTRKFHAEGRSDHHYDNFPLEAINDLSALVRDTEGLRGLNVTIPYKRSVLPLLHSIDPMAAAVGAVNTIRVTDGRLEGFNTDVDGFRQTLAPLMRGPKPRALVLGSGGASRAVVYVLKEHGIKFRVVSRSSERGDLTWDRLEPVIVQVCTLIINTTPLGMFPDVGSLPPVPYGSIGTRHTLIDLVYNPAETLFLREGKTRGARTVNGLPMLHAQAEASWRIWNADRD